MLTALVFVLSFSQARFRRAADDALARSRARDKAALDAFKDYPVTMGLLRLFELGEIYDMDRTWTTDHQALTLSLRGRRQMIVEARAWRRHPTEELRQQRAKRHSTSFITRAARSIIERLDKDSIQVRARVQADSRQGKRKVVGVLLADSGAAFAVLAWAWWLISMLVTISLIGAGYAGWQPTLTPNPDFWVLLSLLAVAAGYVSVVRRDLLDQAQRAFEALEEGVLARLIGAERLLDIHLSLGSFSDADSNRRALEELRKALTESEQQVPGLPWLASLKGRFLLWQHAHDAADEDGEHLLGRAEFFFGQRSRAKMIH
jgi:hypothetical protein